MAKYVRCIEESCGLSIKLGKIYKVKNVLDSGGYELYNVYGMIHKCFMKDCTILDIDLQRINNIVVGTLNYVDGKFEGKGEISISKLSYNKSIFLHDCNISIVKENKGLSDSIMFYSAQEAQDYVDKFTKIIDDINTNQPITKYKINSDKTYTEEEIVKLKELGIDFVKVGEQE